MGVKIGSNKSNSINLSEPAKNNVVPEVSAAPKEKIAPREKKVIQIRRPGDKSEIVVKKQESVKKVEAEKTEENKENKSDIKQNGDISDVVKEEIASPVKEAASIKEVDSVEKNLEKL